MIIQTTRQTVTSRARRRPQFFLLFILTLPLSLTTKGQAYESRLPDSIAENSSHLANDPAFQVNDFDDHLNSSRDAEFTPMLDNEMSSHEFFNSTPNVTSILPLAWEAQVPESFLWSDFTLKTITTYGVALAGARDVSSFCPAYPHLSPEQKINFWGQLISTMSLFESSFKTTSHYRESTMGNDHVTGHHVYSDGLLQLSYQDSEQYKFCSEFDWSHDKNLAERDPRKTIFDPYINLRCGIRILNAQVARTGLISYRSGQYWSVLWPTHVAKIKAITRKIPYCMSK